ncbi:hypothetical protein IW15_12060 [Chryseobacterium soli]|uniref:Uncharacterized protein n=1 Tax=Chryseobacterium soli TaxID=445961 RepID=A0A086A6H3_9FLAO|nr:hypothetical protein IW15_12060 [Chryseobacterium soli]
MNANIIKIPYNKQFSQVIKILYSLKNMYCIKQNLPDIPELNVLATLIYILYDTGQEFFKFRNT